MTDKSETRQDQLTARKALDGETRRALDEVAHHSLGRTGKTAHAIEAGLAALRDDAVLAPGHRQALEEFAGRISESTPSADGAGILRCVRWRDAVLALLGVLRPDPLWVMFANFAASLTPQQAEQLDRPLSEQQLGCFQQVVEEAVKVPAASRTGWRLGVTFPVELEEDEAGVIEGAIREKFAPERLKEFPPAAERLLGKMRRVLDKFRDKRREDEAFAASLTDEERRIIRDRRISMAKKAQVDPGEVGEVGHDPTSTGDKK